MVDEPVNAGDGDEHPGSAQLNAIREEKARMSDEAAQKAVEAGALEPPSDTNEIEAEPVDVVEADEPTEPFAFSTHAQADNALLDYGVSQNDLPGWVNMSVKDKAAALNSYFGL